MEPENGPHMPLARARMDTSYLRTEAQADRLHPTGRHLTVDGRAVVGHTATQEVAVDLDL